MSYRRLLLACFALSTCPAALATPPAPQAVVAWPSGVLEVRVAFDRPLDATIPESLVDQRILYGAADGTAEARRSSKPPSSSPTPTQGTIRIAGARLEDEGRTLILATDPHPLETRYSLGIPALNKSGANASGPPTQVSYSLSGVEASWTSDDEAEPPWTGWWPHLDPRIVRESTLGSADHERSLALLAKPGVMTLRTLLKLPAGRTSLEVSGTPTLEEMSLGGEPAELGGGGRSATISTETDGQTLELLVALRTGSPAPLWQSSIRTPADPAGRPLRASEFTVPWSPGPPLEPRSTDVPPNLVGGDIARGENIFFSEDAKCSSCHKIRGKGGVIGPDLSELEARDVASIYREIAEPSAVIRPDYLPYTIATTDGRVAVGVVRAEGADSIRVMDTNAQVTLIRRGEIADIQPSRTSIMPVGLAGALGEARLRDLIAFLASLPSGTRE